MLLDDICRRATQDPRAFIEKNEAEFREKIDALAYAVANGASHRPVVLLSGPSGSSKTTTSHLLAAKLRQMGINAHIVSMDNYFRTFSEEEQRLFRRHELDLESPERVDNDLLSAQVEAIMRGDKVFLPHFDFTTNISHKSEQTLQRRKDEIVIFEGIHALNPSVLGSTDDYTTRIYVSVRTRVEHDGGRLLHPSKVRLARRMIRDKRERARSFSDVVWLYPSVERGEDLYIMPYKHRADFDVDTFIPYELCVYKNFLPERMPKEESLHRWLPELFEVLAQLPTIDPALVPPNTLIREFIG